jgi:hypothetical protein
MYDQNVQGTPLISRNISDAVLVTAIIAAAATGLRKAVSDDHLSDKMKGEELTQLEIERMLALGVINKLGEDDEQS